MEERREVVTDIDTCIGFTHEIGVLVSERRESIIERLEPMEEMKGNVGDVCSWLASAGKAGPYRLIDIEDMSELGPRARIPTGCFAAILELQGTILVRQASHR